MSRASKPIKLNKKELRYLSNIKSSGKLSDRKHKRINILLLLNDGKSHTDIADFLKVSRGTIWRIKERYLEEGVKQAIEEKERPGQPVKYTTDLQAELVALVCSACPKGRQRWTLELLTSTLKSKPGFETINKESVRLILKKNECKPWLKKMWCIEKINKEFRKRMYILLALYKLAYDPLHPVVCMDEKSKQLLKDARQPIKAKPGSLEKYDYEYVRNGTSNIFMAIDIKGCLRHVKVTNTRKKADFAHFIADLVEIHYPNVEYIYLVMDNLNTHRESSLLETFGEEKTKALMKKLRFVYTPVHASWLNMAEIEINIMDRQCTSARIGTIEELIEQLEKWAADRNLRGCTIEWKFTRQQADKKLSKHYV